MVKVGILVSAVILAAASPSLAKGPRIEDIANKKGDSKEILAVARGRQKPLAKKLWKALKSKKRASRLGALRVIAATGRGGELKRVAALASDDDEKVAELAVAALVGMSSKRSTKALFKEWDRVAKESPALLPFLGEAISKGPVSYLLLHKLADRSAGEDGEPALSALRKLLAAVGVPNVGDASTARSAIESEILSILGMCKRHKVSPSSLPLILFSRHRDKQRYGANILIGEGGDERFDCAEGLHLRPRSLVAGYHCSVWAMLRPNDAGDALSALTVVTKGGMKTGAYHFQLVMKPTSYVMAGKDSMTTRADLANNWVKFEWAWVPFKDEATQNFLIRLNGVGAFGGEAKARWNQVEAPVTFQVICKKGSVLLGGGELVGISSLP